MQEFTFAHSSDRNHHSTIYNDKDNVATKLGQIIRANEFCIITDLKYVYCNFGSLKQTPIWGITHMEIKEFYKCGEFQQSSIAPKIKATMHFLKYHNGEFYFKHQRRF